MAYATLDDLASYLEVAQTDLPANNSRLLKRASDLIDRATRGVLLKADPVKDAEQLTAAKNAVTAQVEYWNLIGEEVDILGTTGSEAIGSFSMTGKLPTIAPRARDYLFTAGLMTNAVSMGAARNTNRALAAQFFTPPYWSKPL